jgi:4-oxalocrotonate tautomerase
MPLVRIALREGKGAEYKRLLADGVHQAMVETMGVPAADRFQSITEHGPDDFIYDANYLNVQRSDNLVFIQISLSAGRTVEQKRAFYRRAVEVLGARPGIRAEDVFINLVEVGKDADTSKSNWSFGNGVAQYL